MTEEKKAEYQKQLQEAEQVVERMKAELYMTMGRISVLKDVLTVKGDTVNAV